MSKLLKIESCRECDFCNKKNGGRYNKEEDKFYDYNKHCIKADRFMDDINVIPDWCELQDADELESAYILLKRIHKHVRCNCDGLSIFDLQDMLMNPKFRAIKKLLGE